MKIDLYWDNEEQTMLLCEFQAGWTWDDLTAILTTIKRLSHERQRTLGAMIDVRNGMTLPGGSLFNAEALKNFQKILQISGDGADKGPVAVVGAGGMIGMVIEAIRRINAALVQDVVLAKTLDEARSQLYPRLQKVTA